MPVDEQRIRSSVALQPVTAGRSIVRLHGRPIGVLMWGGSATLDLRRQVADDVARVVLELLAGMLGKPVRLRTAEQVAEEDARISAEMRGPL